MFDTIININLGCPCKDRRVRFQFAFGLPEPKGSMPAEVTITNEQKVPVTLAPVTATGKPAKLDGPPTWTVVSGEGTVEVSEDGLTATLVSSDNPGDTQYMVEADADLGEGVETISDIVTLHVAGAKAANLGLTVGTPVAK